MTTLSEKEQSSGRGLVWLGRGVWILVLWLLLPWLLPNLWSGALLGSDQLAWYLVRASGTVGYLTMTASMLWGLLLSSKMIKDVVPPVLSLAMHNTLSWIALGLSVFHAVMLLFDNYYTFRVANLLIPFTGPYSPLWVGMGILGFYLMLVTTLSFYVRKQLGQKNWRRLHYATFAAYVLTTVHGLMAGTDAALLGGMFGVSALSVIFLTIYRILATVTEGKNR